MMTKKDQLSLKNGLISIMLIFHLSRSIVMDADQKARNYFIVKIYARFASVVSQKASIIVPHVKNIFATHSQILSK